MACACKVNQQLSYLQKHYGNKDPRSSEPNTHIAEDIKFIFKKVGVVLVLIPVFPIMGIYLLGRKIFKRDNTMVIDKLVRPSLIKKLKK